MARLPLPGGDDGTWGTILNDYLTQVHNADGTLKADAVSNINIVNATIQAAKLAQTYIQSSEKGSASGVASLDATTKVPVAQLPSVGGDLSGTVTNAQIVAGAVATTEIADNSVTVAKLAAAIAESLVPSGAITPFAGSAAPTGWFSCDGSAISRATYAALFAAIGTTYGAGDGSTTFNLPNLKGRVPVGVDAAQTEFDTRGETGGAKTHLLSSAEMPSHTHVQDAHTHIQDAHNHTQNSHNHTQNAHSHGGITGNDSPDHSHSTQVGWSEWYNTHDWAIVNGADRSFSVSNVVPSGGASTRHQHSITGEAATNIATTATNIATTATNIATTATNQTTTATNQSTGGGLAHNNLQPYIALNYIIKY